MHATLSTELNLPDYIPDSLTVPHFAIEFILSSLQFGKAAGTDAINNRIIKEGLDGVY